MCHLLVKGSITQPKQCTEHKTWNKKQQTNKKKTPAITPSEGGRHPNPFRTLVRTRGSLAVAKVQHMDTEGILGVAVLQQQETTVLRHL